MSLFAGRNLVWTVAAMLALLDQISKALFVRVLEPGRSLTIIPGFFDLTLVTNTGGVFGLLRDVEGPVRKILFGILPLVAVFLMIRYARSLSPSRSWSMAGIGLIMGGAAGNLVDRLRYGHVVDFLDAYIGELHWPVFNLADSGICVGVAMLLMESFFSRPTGDETRPVAPSPPP
jgi:signal peptidase II